ncbi:MAG: DUF4417 domain-containing protein [Spirochaetia bacterium]|nr:DUF4417 domain-containing protein [Spirochaetia bacterium]MDY4986129.1 DUF4417 domain-containing protein [Treponema sp.]
METKYSKKNWELSKKGQLLFYGEIEMSNKKDVFGCWQIKNYDFDKDRVKGITDEYPIVIGTQKIPEQLVLFGKESKPENLKDASNRSIHFFQHDYLFEPTIRSESKSISKLEVFKKYQSVILPDCSIYTNLPLPVQQYQTYKSRAFGIFLSDNGVNIIPSVRWGDKYSWDFCFSGIMKNSLLAVGTLSALGTSEDKRNFHAGFLEMLNRLEPASLIIYGKLPEEEKVLCHERGIYFREYPTERTKYENNKKLSERLMLFEI